MAGGEAQPRGSILVGVVLYKLGGEYRTWDELTRLDAACLPDKDVQAKPVLRPRPHRGDGTLDAAGDPGRRVGAGAVRESRPAASTSTCLTLGTTRWNMTPPVGIDGGPLGFLTWTVPLIAGTLAYDIVARAEAAEVARLLGWAAILMIIGVWAVMPRHASSRPTRRTEPGWTPWPRRRSCRRSIRS